VAERIPHRGLTTAILAGRVVGAGPVSKRGAQLRDTRDSEPRDDFDIRRQGWTRGRPAGAEVATANSPRYPRSRWRACRTRKPRKSWKHDYPVRSRS